MKFREDAVYTHAVVGGVLFDSFSLLTNIFKDGIMNTKMKWFGIVINL